MRRAGVELVALAALLGIFSNLQPGDLAVQRTGARTGRRTITRSTGIARGELDHDRTDFCGDVAESSSAPDLDPPSAPPCIVVEVSLAASAPVEGRSARPTSRIVAQQSIEHELPAARAPPLAA